jgi:DNA-binding GntR family transcriptional regulator
VNAEGLAGDRALLERLSTADRVADILRTRISEGFFAPGSRLSEKEIVDALGISRNSLREAFRLLSRERLVGHELNRGVFVRVPDVDDVVDIYRVRRLVECAAARVVTSTTPGVQRVADAVRTGERALAARDWRTLGTADIMFHQEVAALAGSSRVDELMRGVLAELRLVFHVMDDPRWFHEPYLGRNREILAALSVGDGARAEGLLADYLTDAQRQLLQRYPAHLG